jgi:prepilin-type N-terminal cleavage/methylation domain-containing protein/prepilin-type processing-associated H-X9-DG protein
MRPRSTLRKARRGFTLVELLVVIVIIAILVGLVSVGVNRGLEMARAVKTTSQIRQIASATLLFANENNGYLPKVAATGTSGDAEEFTYLMLENGVADLENSGLNPYLGEDEDIWLAPGDNGLKEDGSPGRNFSYTFNFLINKGQLEEGASDPSGFEQALGTVRVPLIDEPSKKIIVFEEDQPNDGFCVWFIDQPVDRHNGKAHVAFADGHVEALPKEEIFANGELCDLVPPNKQY